MSHMSQTLSGPIPNTPYIWQEHACLWKTADEQECHRVTQGLLYGYGCYTSFRWPLTADRLLAHWERLLRDSCALGFAPLEGFFSMRDASSQALFESLQATLGQSDCRVRISLLPGTASIGGLLQSGPLSCQALLSVGPLDPMPLEKPAILKLLDKSRPMASIKHAQIAETIYERRSAQGIGADEILFSVWEAGSSGRCATLCEAGFANVVAVNPKQKALLSPNPQRWPCLPGTTVSDLFEMAQKAGWRIELGDLPLSRLAADYNHLCLCNAVYGIRAVQKIIVETGETLWADSEAVQTDELTLAQWNKQLGF